jgi:hypothetical protein
VRPLMGASRLVSSPPFFLPFPHHPPIPSSLLPSYIAVERDPPFPAAGILDACSRAEAAISAPAQQRRLATGDGLGGANGREVSLGEERVKAGNANGGKCVGEWIA